jgi:hypothetical protein
MIGYRSGNLLEADAEALVNTVNCVGVLNIIMVPMPKT